MCESRINTWHEQPAVPALLAYTWDHSLLADANNNASFVLTSSATAPTLASASSCKFFTCVQFAGQSFLQAPAINLGKHPGLSFSVWYRPSADAKTKLFEFSDGEDQNNIYLGKSASEGLIAGVHRNDRQTDTAATRPGGWVTGAWSHVVWTLRTNDRVQSLWNIWLDGVALLTDQAGLYPSDALLTSNFIGTGSWAADTPFSGHMDSFYIFSKSLTQAEAIALYQVASLLQSLAILAALR
jgi:hypothetical protein